MTHRQAPPPTLPYTSLPPVRNFPTTVGKLFRAFRQTVSLAWRYTSLGSEVFSILERVEDPRRDHLKEHSLECIFYTTTAAVLGGAESWNEVLEFGRLHEDFLRSRINKIALPTKEQPAQGKSDHEAENGQMGYRFLGELLDAEWNMTEKEKKVGNQTTK